MAVAEKTETKRRLTKEARREQLLETALDIVREQGPDALTLGYLAERSGHSTGAAVDLTLVDLRASVSPPFDPGKAYGNCIAPEAQRAPEASVDMGTGYDCSDAKAWTASRAINAAQRRWRDILVTSMRKQGFVNYSKEWWHFSMPGVGTTAYDFPIRR